MPLCNACTSFFRTAFVPPKQKEKYGWERKHVPHLRVPDIFESATKCEVCALIKTCSMRTFHELLEEFTNDAFLRFMAANFPDEQITLTLDRVYNDETAPRSRAVRVCLPDPYSNVPEHLAASQNINFSLWATVAALSKDVSDIPPIRHDGSGESLRLIGLWLANCLDNHVGQDCHKTLSGSTLDEHAGGTLPKRIIDVMPSDGRHHVRLVEPNGLRGHYAALSHCWGPPEKQPKRTLTENLSQHLSSISLDVLPKTFYEAVQVTRAAGIRYLWVDSLCIVQDDDSDWEQGSKTMGALYENARFTIAANDATDASKGLFLTGRQQDDPVSEIAFQPNGQEAEGVFYVSAGPRRYHPNFSRSPLQKRAWAFQERHLSRRVCFFTCAGMFWYCKSGHDQKRTFSLTIDKRGIQWFDDTKMGWEWQDNVEQYSKRHLTYESDRLIALQGLAAEIGKTRSDTYHMGIWTSELPDTLLWLGRDRDVGDDYQKDIPTWSWASLSGRKKFIENPRLWVAQRQQRIFLDKDTEKALSMNLRAKATTGDNGTLVLDAYLKKASSNKATFECVNMSADGDFSYSICVLREHGVYCIIDGSGKEVGGAAFDVAFHPEFHCLFLCNGVPYKGNWFHYVLLLEPTEEPSTFRRIGLGYVTLQTWFEGEKVQRVRPV